MSFSVFHTNELLVGAQYKHFATQKIPNMGVLLYLILVAPLGIHLIFTNAMGPRFICTGAFRAYS